MSILCMKTRTCLLFATCLVGAICVSFLWLVGDEDRMARNPRRASWNILVSQTHQHLRDFQYQLTDVDSYLRLLGFEPEEYLRKVNFGSEQSQRKEETPSNNVIPKRPPVLSSMSSQAYVRTFPNLSTVTPVIAVPVQSGQLASAWDLYNSVLLHAPTEWMVYFYDLSLGYYERLDLANRCKNVSGFVGGIPKKTAMCQVRHFDWSLFPSHVSQYKLEAYRPLIINDALNASGGVFYLSPGQRLRDRVPDAVLDKARRLGVIGWRLDDDSTSAITHPKSFAFFNGDAQNYYFHHTIRGDRLLVFNTPSVRLNLVLPWLQCSLKLRCVSPLGAQDTGCRLYRKPLYLYSGCHHYDVSVMNTVLGLMFGFDSTSYTVDAEEGKFISAQADLVPQK